MNTPFVKRSEDIHAWRLYVLQLDLESINVDRDRFIELMVEQGVGTSVHFIPFHIQPYWRDKYNYQEDDFPVALNGFLLVIDLY